MLRKTSILLLIVISAFYSCNNNSSTSSKHTIEQTKYKEGNIASETSYLDGVKDGPHKEYFPNGGVQVEKQFKNGMLVAEKLYTIEGEIIKNIVIKDGRKYGLLFSSFCTNGVARNPENDSLTIIKK